MSLKVKCFVREIKPKKIYIEAPNPDERGKLFGTLIGVKIKPVSKNERFSITYNKETLITDNLGNIIPLVSTLNNYIIAEIKPKRFTTYGRLGVSLIAKKIIII